MFIKLLFYVDRLKQRRVWNGGLRVGRCALLVMASALIGAATFGQNIVAPAVTAGAYPNGIAVNPVTNKIYVVNTTSGNVTVVDGATNQTTTLSDTHASGLYSVAVNPATNCVYVANHGSNNISVFCGVTVTSPVTYQTTISAGDTGTWSIAVNPVTNMVYAGNDNGTATGSVTVINGHTNTIAAPNITVGQSPQNIAINPATNLIYVVNRGDNTHNGSVSVIDGGSNMLANFGSNPITVGVTATSVAVNAVTNRIYVVNVVSNNISVINGASGTLMDTRADTGTSTPTAIAVNPVTNQIYVSNYGSKTSVFDGTMTGNNGVTDVPTAGGLAITVDTSTNVAYVANQTAGTVTVIQPGTYATKVLTPNPLQGTTQQIAVNPVTHKVYAANDNASGTVTVIDGATNTFVEIYTNSIPPYVLAVNPVTNLVYVATNSPNSVVVIDGATNTLMPPTIPLSSNPTAMVVDPIRNVVYVANGDSVTSIDAGNSNSTSSIETFAVNANSMAFNPVLNQIYGSSATSQSIFQITGGNVSPTLQNMSFAYDTPVADVADPALGMVYTLLASGNVWTTNSATFGGAFEFGVCYSEQTPTALDINPVTLTLFVTCSDPFNGGTVWALPGASSFGITGTEAVIPLPGPNYATPSAVAVNPSTNIVWVADSANASVYSINVANSYQVSSPIPVGANPVSIGINVATNKIYVVSQGVPSITVIDGATNSVLATIHLTGPSGALNEIAANPETGTIYGVDQGGNAVVAIAENKTQTNAIHTTINPLPTIAELPANSTDIASPTFTFTPTNGFTSGAVTGVYFQVDTQQGTWTPAPLVGGNFTGTATNLTPGFHILYAFATEGEDATSIVTGPQSGPLVGPIAAYSFLVAPPIGYTNIGPGVFNVSLGSTSTHFDPLLFNDGAAPMQYSFEIVGPNYSDFVINPTNNFGFTPCTQNGTLLEDTYCSVDITFTPSALGPETATLVWTDNSLGIPNSTQTVGLQGTGVPATAFSNLTPSQQIVVGTGPITLSGLISAGPGNFPPTFESVSITINSVPPVTQNVSIQSDGTFSASLNTTGIGVSPTPYPITYSYGGDSSFTSASDSSTSLVVATSVTPPPVVATVTLLGTGIGSVTDGSSLTCNEANGITTGTCSAVYGNPASVTLTAAPDSSATFAGWGGACPGTGTGSTCILSSVTSPVSVTANFTTNPVPVPLNFSPGSDVSGMATFNCPSNSNPTPGNPCLDPDAHALALTIPKVNSLITLYVTATEVPTGAGNGVGDCLSGQSVPPVNNFDCRFATFFNYGPDGSGGDVVPLCVPYANGNCVFYTVNTGTTPPEPDVSSYVGPINWTVSWNNELFVPSGTYAASTPRLYEDPDADDPGSPPLTPTTPYGTNCGVPMSVDSGPPPTFACQFEFDITTSFDPTKQVDAAIQGHTKQFSDVVVAYPPESVGQLTVTTQADEVAPAPGSALGFTINVFNSTEGVANSVSLNDALPAGTGVNWSISPAYAGGYGTCGITGSVGSQVLSCSFGTLPARTSFSVHVSSPSSSVGSYTSAATVTAMDQQVLSVATITVQLPQPIFQGLSPSQAVKAGPGSIDVSGTISAGVNGYPPAGDMVTVTINGNSVPAMIGINGFFTTSFKTMPISASPIPYPITYSYAGDTNFAAASNNSTWLTVTSFIPTTGDVTLLGTGTGAVTDDQDEISCAENSGITVGTCSAVYAEHATVTFTETPDPISHTTFGGWGGACAFAAMNTACELTSMTGTNSVTANFIPQPAMQNLTFPPSDSTTTKMATFDCTMNTDPTPDHPCTDPNAHAIALTIPQVFTPFTLTVVATEFPATNGNADGDCPSSATVFTDFDCRFVTAFTFATEGSLDRIVPLCDPYANGNCVHYVVYYQTVGTEPDPSWYDSTDGVNWTVSWNNDQVVPPAPYSGSAPRLYEDPDSEVDLTTPYGSICNLSNPMYVGGSPTNPPIYCQFDIDITTSFDPTKKVDAAIQGHTKQFSDVVVAFPPSEFSGLTPSQTITAGTSPVALAGTIGVDGTVPASSETVSIAIGPSGGPALVTATAPVAGGAFSASVNTSAIPASAVPFVITYSYAGDTNLSPATDTSTTLTVNAPGATPTTTTVTSSSGGSSSFGFPVTFTAMVDPDNTVPTGTVQFILDSVNLGQPIQLVTGTTCTSGTPCAVASTTVTTLGLGTHTVSANYIPTNGFASSSGTLAGGINVGTASLTVTGITANNKVYDGTTAATLNVSGAALSGVASGDTGCVSLVATGASGTFASANVANGISVAVSGLTLMGGCSGNYTLTQPSTTANITARATSTSVGLVPGSVTAGGSSTITVTVTDTSAAPTFSPGGTVAFTSSDTTPSADTFSTCALSGANPNTCTATVTTHEVGNSPHTINATYTPLDNIHSGSSGNAPLTVTAGSIGTTTTVTSSANPATYGGSVSFTATIVPGSGSAAPTGSVQFVVDGSNFGTPVTVASCASSPDACATNSATTTLSATTHTVIAIYTATGTFTSGTGTLSGGQVVNKKPTTATVTASYKIYDGTTTATITNCSLSGIVAMDAVSCSAASATFSDRSAANGKTVTATGITLSGGSAANYSLTSTTATTTANITVKTLTLAGNLAASNKVYDKTPTATFTGAAVLQTAEAAGTGTTADGVPYSGDTVSLAGTPVGTFASVNVGNGIGVSVSGLSLAGAQSVDYALSVPSFTANITARPLTVTSAANTKPYDGTTTAAALPTITTGVLQGSDTGNFKETYNSAAVGTGKTLTPSGAVNDGNSGNNYGYSFVAVTTGVITARTTSITVGLSPSAVTAGGTSNVTVIVTDTSTGAASNPAGTVVLTSSDTGTNGDTFTTCTLANSGSNAATCTVIVTTKEVGTSPHTITATYTPNESFHTASSGSAPLTVNSSGTSTLKFSPTTLNFGTVYPGSFTLRSTTITNTGTSMVTFSNFGVAPISGDDSTGFIGVDFCPKTLNAGKSCTVIMSFVANSDVTKTRAATLVFTDNAPGSPQMVLMSATVINPQANAEPESLSFGTEKAGSTTTKTVTLTNTGTTALNITKIAITGSNAADFTQTNGCGTSLAAGGHCTISVAFKPASKSSFSANLTITDNAPSGQQTVSLSGKGD